jgi:hypothetical protein
MAKRESCLRFVCGDNDAPAVESARLHWAPCDSAAPLQGGEEESGKSGKERDRKGRIERKQERKKGQGSRFDMISTIYDKEGCKDSRITTE